MDNGETSLLPEWRQALKDFLAMNPQPGFTIEKAWLMRAFGIDEPVTADDQKKAELRFLQSMDSFRDCLLVEHMVDLKTVPGVGFRVIAPQDQTRHAIITRTRNAKRELARMVREVSFVKLDELTDEQRRENTDARVKAANLLGMMRSTRLLSNRK